MFGDVTEGVESVSHLMECYTVIEKLYLHEDCEATPQMQESITKLYVAVLHYLSKAKDYFSGKHFEYVLNRGGANIWNR
jgi:hypothetical protein